MLKTKYENDKKRFKKICLKKITVPSDCWEKSNLFLRKFSLQKDYSSKWVGENFLHFSNKCVKVDLIAGKKLISCH